MALIVIGAIVVLFALGGVLAAISGGAPATTAKGGNASHFPGRPEKKSLFPARPDKKKNDVERNVGQLAELSGYSVSSRAALFESQISDSEAAGYIATEVYT